MFAKLLGQEDQILTQRGAIDQLGAVRIGTQQNRAKAGQCMANEVERIGFLGFNHREEEFDLQELSETESRRTSL